MGKGNFEKISSVINSKKVWEILQNIHTGVHKVQKVHPQTVEENLKFWI